MPPARLVAEFSDEMLAAELPALPAERRAEAVAFTGRRIAGMPSPMLVGVSLVAFGVGAAGQLIGMRRVANFLSHRPLPVVGDYVRLIRSLAYTYVWETWPGTGADGAPT